MIELNTTTPTAPADILSLIASLDAPGNSTNSSATTAQDFSAMLTEMIGSALPASLSTAPGLTVAAPAESTKLSATVSQNVNPQSGQALQPAPAAQLPQPAQLVHPALPQLAQAPQPARATQAAQLAQATQAAQPAQATQAAQPAQAAQAAQPAQPAVAVPVQLPLPQVQTQPVQAQQVPAAPAPSDSQPAEKDQQTPVVPQLQPEQALPKSLAPEKPKDPAKVQDPQQAQPNPVMAVSAVPLVPVTIASCAATQDKSALGHETQSPAPQKVGDPALPPTTVPLPAALQQQVQRAWADVKKFEFKVQTETARPAAPQGQPQVAPAEAPKQAIITTDPLANIQLQQLPPRITAIEKLAPEGRLADRARPDAEHQTTDGATAAPVMHFADMTRSADNAAPVEHTLAAHTVEMPNLPHIQVVRTVSMEVGEADSQVMVRIQERAGDISLQINAGSEPLHEGLQSSVGSLVSALKQEQVQVSNVEVSRKSPIEKVRRMKEAN